MHSAVVHPSQFDFQVRTSVIDNVANILFIAPIGHKYLHHNLFSYMTEFMTAPDVMSSRRQADRAPL